MKKILTAVTAVILILTMGLQAFAATDAEAAEGLISLQDRYDLTPEADSESPETFPARLDLRERGVVTPVKLQNPFGTCWGFAAVSAAETSILSELGETYEDTGLDLSEHQLTYFAGTPLKDGSSQEGEGRYLLDESENVLNIGGWMTTVTSVLSSGIGLVGEETVPYRGKEGRIGMILQVSPLCYSDEDDWTVPEKYRFMQTYELEESSMLPETSIKKWNDLQSEYEYLGFSQKGVDAIKSELMNGRAVSIAFAADQYLPGQVGEPKYLSQEYCHYTYDNGIPNHAVTIVGWDDTVPASDFIGGHEPPADGAWIVKNSWGAGTEKFPNKFDWGMRDVNMDTTGYFYLSYYDRSITSPMTLDFDVETGGQTDHIDQYDYMPDDSLTPPAWVSEDELKMANVFTAGQDETICILSTETLREEEDVLFELYLLADDAEDPEDGRPVFAKTEHYTYGGYHRTVLDEPLEVKAGQKYAVIVTQTMESGEYGELYEITASRGRTKEGLEYYNSRVEEDLQERAYGKAVVNEGESFLYSQGGWNDWADVTAAFASDEEYSRYTYDNFSIKAYAKLADGGAAGILSGEDAECCYPEPVETYWEKQAEGYMRILFVSVLAQVIIGGIVFLVIRLVRRKKRKWKKRTLKVLFIGNSHTYYNEMPSLFRALAAKQHRRAEVAMIAHGGWRLRQHLETDSREAAVSIKNGGYEYVVLQAHTHPFEEENEYLDSVRRFNSLIRDAHAVPVIYGTWARKEDPLPEAEMEALQKRAAEEIDALYAPVGEVWWRKQGTGQADLFGPDGCHANAEGSALAAEILWDVISRDSLSRTRWKWYRRERRKSVK